MTEEDIKEVKHLLKFLAEQVAVTAGVMPKDILEVHVTPNKTYAIVLDNNNLKLELIQI